MTTPKRWTRLSLFYLAGYAGPAGLALLIAPQFTTHLLLSNGTYPDVIIRMAGVALASLGVFVIQMVRLELEALYTTTLGVRVFICTSFAALYLESHDPLFLALIGIVGFGFLITLISVLHDRRLGPA